jgi:uncharacterized protein (TIGR02413 family)
MTLNLIFATLTIKKRVKTIEEYMHEESISEMYEQNKLKHNDMLLRHYY